MAEAFMAGARAALWICGFVVSFFLVLVSFGLASKLIDWMFGRRKPDGD